MVQALRVIRTNGLKQACLTNNFVGMATEDAFARLSVLDLFDAVFESSKIGVRKPEPAFYSIACAKLGIEPSEAVMLDDLGVNLKPARDLGMKTIKVVDETKALEELEAILGVRLRCDASPD
jgi:putative hydrolase of the HAD superfamily